MTSTGSRPALPSPSSDGLKEGVVPAQPQPRRSVGSPAAIAGWVSGSAFAALLVARNRYIFTQRIYEEGDLAVNSILIDRARVFRLLVGNYSRVGFNHPGPAFLYVQAWGQWLLHSVLGIAPSPYGGQLFGILLLNAAVVGVAATIIVHHTGHRWAALVFVVAVLALQPTMIGSTWMPYVYVCPFLLFVVSTGSLLTRSARYCWAWALSAGLLVHGHVSFTLFVVAIAGALALLAVFTRWSTGTSPPRRQLISAGVVASVFAVPIALNLLLHWPGELRRYASYSGGKSAGGHTVGQAARYLRSYWTDTSPNGWLVVAALIAAAATLVVTQHPGQARCFCTMLLASCGLMTALTFVYALRGIDDLAYSYIAAYYVMVPLMVIVTIFVSVGTRSSGVAGKGLLAVLSLATVFVAARPGLTNPYRGVAWTPLAAAAIEAKVPNGTVTVMQIGTSSWSQTAAIVEFERRRGRPVCIADASLGFLFSRALVCSASSLATGHHIWVDATQSHGTPLFASSDVIVSDGEPRP